MGAAPFLIHAVLAACTGNKGAGAQSAPTPVQVVEANCDQPWQLATPCPPTPPGGTPSGDGGLCNTTLYYAVASFPGLSAAQLAGHVTNWTALPDSGIPNPPGFALRGQDAIYTADGMVGAGCDQGTKSTFVYAP